jgi:hypothetical protein
VKNYGKRAALAVTGLMVGMTQGRAWEMVGSVLFVDGHEYRLRSLSDDLDDDEQRETPEEVLQRQLLARAHKVVATIEDRRVRSAPQLRVVTREVKAAQAMLGLVLDHLGVVHELAYDRVKAADRLKVMGGTHDYALDTNGDPKARELYTQVAYETEDLIRLLAVAAHELVAFMKTPEPAGLHRRRRVGDECAPADVVVALEARERRIARGEGTAPLVSQPTVKTPTLAEVTAELKHLRAAVAKTHPRLTNAERGRLTTIEQLAWRTAVPEEVRASAKPPATPRPSFHEQREQRGALPKKAAPEA